MAESGLFSAPVRRLRRAHLAFVLPAAAGGESFIRGPLGTGFCRKVPGCHRLSRAARWLQAPSSSWAQAWADSLGKVDVEHATRPAASGATGAFNPRLL
jgi:hypothetical protein